MSYQQLSDETFPASLLMEFDSLDDEIPISPPRLVEPDKTNNAAGRSPVATAHTSGSNTSSGNYSFSTENDNGSSSSGSSNPSCAYPPISSNRNITLQDTKRATTDDSAKPVANQKKAKSLDNLLNNVSSKIQNSTMKYQKYGHIKSKVKQYIDETTKKRNRQPLLRHKSMPDTCMESPGEKKDEFDQETNKDNLRIMLREKIVELEGIQRHLNFCEMQREDNVFTIEALKRKIESMRLEHSKREYERQREREIEKDREKQAIINTYLCNSNPSLNRIFASVSTQTSPELHRVFNISSFQCDESFQELLTESFDIRGSRFIRSSQQSADLEQDKPDERSEHEMICPDSQSSPDYPLLLPQPLQGFSASRRINPGETEISTQDHVAVCRQCIARNKKKRKKKIRLASFFCIKNVKD